MSIPVSSTPILIVLPDVSVSLDGIVLSDVSVSLDGSLSRISSKQSNQASAFFMLSDSFVSS